MTPATAESWFHVRAVLQDRRLAFSTRFEPGVAARFTPNSSMKTMVQALFGAVFRVGHRFVFQWRMASSSRLIARPLGRWQEKFSPLSSRHTPTPNTACR